jgi:transcriptional regulator with XRE-family HTH domain
MMHMPDSGSDVLTHVAGNLRRLRQERGLSQTALAERSGISRRTIINLEAGEANISLSGLDRVAEALDTDFVTLVAEPSAPPTAVNAVAWRGGSPDSVAALIGAVPARTDAQLWTWALAPGDRYDAEPDPAGWHEIVFVTAGSLRIDRDDGVSALAAGEHAIYSSAQRYSYIAVGAQTVRFVRLVVS